MTPEANAQADEAAAWLLSADARAAATFELRRVGLRDSSLVDDVLSEVACSVTRRLAMKGVIPAVDPDRSPVVPYARRSVRNAATDLVRAPRPLTLEDVLGDSGDPVVEGVDVSRSLRAVESDSAFDAVRGSVHVSMPGNAPWAAAAALVVLVLAHDPAHPVDAGTPAPEITDEPKRYRWAGLHYAGRQDCFPGDAAESGACRMRRSRALARLDDLLEAAWEDAGDGR